MLNKVTDMLLTVPQAFLGTSSEVTIILGYKKASNCFNAYYSRRWFYEAGLPASDNIKSKIRIVQVVPVSLKIKS